MCDAKGRGSKVSVKMTLKINKVICERPLIIDVEHCTAHWSTWLISMIKPSQETTHFLLTHFSWLWWIVNNVGFIQDRVTRAVYFCKFMQNMHVELIIHNCTALLSICMIYNIALLTQLELTLSRFPTSTQVTTIMQHWKLTTIGLTTLGRCLLYQRTVLLPLVWLVSCFNSIHEQKLVEFKGVLFDCWMPAVDKTERNIYFIVIERLS